MRGGPGSDVRRYRYRPARLLVVGVLVLVLVAAVAVLYRSWTGRADLSDSATVTASSTLPGTDPNNLAGGRAGSTGATGWAAASVRAGAWVRFDWSGEQRVGTLQVTRPAITAPGVTTGFLEFSDGSRLAMPLSAETAVTRLSFQPRSVRWVRFTVSGFAAGTRRLALTSISIARLGPRDQRVGTTTSGGNLAPGAAVTTAPGAGDAQALADGDAAGATGAAWTPGTPTGAWAEYHWSSPQEIASIELVGAAGPDGGYVRSAHLTLDDTSGVSETIPLGGVSPQPGRPTIVGFLPRVVTGVRLTIDSVGAPGGAGTTGDRTGTASLAEWQVYRRGSTPAAPTDLAGAAGATPTTGSAVWSSSTPATDDPETTCAGADDVGADNPVTVLCPLLGAAVGDRVSLRLRLGAGYDAVSATPWPGVAGQADGPTVRASAAAGGVRDGLATLDLDLSSMGAGPLTVAIEATGSGRAAADVRLTLDHRSGSPSGPTPDQGADQGPTRRPSGEQTTAGRP